jgi:hypothetical protein
MPTPLFPECAAMHGLALSHNTSIVSSSCCLCSSPVPIALGNSVHVSTCMVHHVQQHVQQHHAQLLFTHMLSVVASARATAQCPSTAPTDTLSTPHPRLHCISRVGELLEPWPCFHWHPRYSRESTFHVTWYFFSG